MDHHMCNDTYCLSFRVWMVFYDVKFNNAETQFCANLISNNIVLNMDRLPIGVWMVYYDVEFLANFNDKMEMLTLMNVRHWYASIITRKDQSNSSKAVFKTTKRAMNKFPHSWLITECITRLAWWVPLVEQELSTRPEY